MTAAAGIIGFIGGFSTCLVAVACCRDRSITNKISAGAFEHNGKLFSVREVQA